MIPNDTNEDTLGVYYDFLEDDGLDTSELRENVSNIPWMYEYRYVRCYNVGSFGATLGITNNGKCGGQDIFNTVGVKDNNGNIVGTADNHDYFYYNAVGSPDTKNVGK